MDNRQLFLIAYDIADARRLNRVHQLANRHAMGGQKSFYECWLSPAERQNLMAQMSAQIDQDEDRILFLRLDPRQNVETLGCALSPKAIDFFYIA